MKTSHRSLHHLARITASIGIALTVCSCATAPYHPQGDLFPNPEPFVDEPQISRGEPNAVADSLGHYLFS